MSLEYFYVSVDYGAEFGPVHVQLDDEVCADALYHHVRHTHSSARVMVLKSDKPIKQESLDRIVYRHCRGEGE